MKATKLLGRVGLALMLLLLLVRVDARPIRAQGPGTAGPFVGPSIRGIPFKGDLRKLPKTKVQDVPLPGPLISSPFPGPKSRSSTPFQDPVRQAPLASLSMPGPVRNFAGLDRVSFGARRQPDVAGDIGPNHFIQAVNLGLGIYDKNGNQLAAVGIQDWWFQSTQTTACYTRHHTGGPIVTYDTLADRWIVADVAVETLANNVLSYYTCIAVSMSSDPLQGGWWFYAMPSDPNPTLTYFFPDEPRVAVWPDGIYLSALMRDTKQSFAWSKVRATSLNRPSLYSGTLTSIYFDISIHPDFINPLWVLPSNMRGTPPPAGTPNFYAAVWDPTTFWLWKFHVDWTTPSNSTMAGASNPNYPSTLTVANFSPFLYSSSNGVPELGGSNLDPHGDNRMLPQMQYRNIGGAQSLWMNHTVSSNGVAGIRWYQILDPNGSISVGQQSTFQPDANYRFMGTSAVDGNGNMALGYTLSSATTHPSLVYTGRLMTDPANTLGQGEITLFAGTGSQNPCTDPCDHGWGNYYSMSVDPVDDCTFWFTGEYYISTTSQDNWSTRIGAFKYPSCNPTPYPTNHTVTFDGIVNPNIEWNPNSDKLGSMNGIDYYATWDANHLSVAMAGGAVNTNTYVVAVDTDSTNHSSTNTGAAAPLVCAGFNGNGKGNLALARSSGSTAKYQVSGGAWAGTWTPNTSTTALDNGSNNVEFQLQWSDLGLAPPNSSVGLYLYVCNGTSLVSAWPPENLQTGTSPVLNTEVVFSTNDAGRIPRTYGRHVGDEQVMVSTGGSFNPLNGYVRLANVSGVSGCAFTASVNGNADTTDPNTIRRTYSLTPGTGCTGLTTDLTLKYEDGKLADNAPDELAGFTESSLSLLRWSGTSWSPLPTTVDTANNTATTSAVNQFSPWSLGKGAPTAVTISSFTAVPLSKGEAGSQSVLGLGLVELIASALVLGARRRVN